MRADIGDFFLRTGNADGNCDDEWSGSDSDSDSDSDCVGGSDSGNGSELIVIVAVGLIVIMIVELVVLVIAVMGTQPSVLLAMLVTSVSEGLTEGAWYWERDRTAANMHYALPGRLCRCCVPA